MHRCCCCCRSAYPSSPSGIIIAALVSCGPLTTHHPKSQPSHFFLRSIDRSIEPRQLSHHLATHSHQQESQPLQARRGSFWTPPPWCVDWMASPACARIRYDVQWRLPNQSVNPSINQSMRTSPTTLHSKQPGEAPHAVHRPGDGAALPPGPPLATRPEGQRPRGAPVRPPPRAGGCGCLVFVWHWLWRDP